MTHTLREIAVRAVIRGENALALRALHYIDLRASLHTPPPPADGPGSHGDSMRPGLSVSPEAA